MHSCDKLYVTTIVKQQQQNFWNYLDRCGFYLFILLQF